MQTEALVEAKSGVAFHRWSVQAGPIFEQISEVWDQIEGGLSKNDVETAASRLRRHLEYIDGEVADRLGANRPIVVTSPTTWAISCPPLSAARASC